MMFHNELIFCSQVAVTAIAAVGSLIGGQSLLVALMALYILLANLLVTKEILLFGLSVTASDALGVGAAFCVALLQEYYGADAARRALMSTLAISLIYLLLVHLHLAYIPAPYDTMHAPGALLFGTAPRLIGASLVAYAISQFCDIMLLARLRARWGTRYFIFRATGALCVTQLIDTIIFIYVGLWGIVSSPVHIIAFSYMIKLLTIACMAPIIGLLRNRYHAHV